MSQAARCRACWNGDGSVHRPGEHGGCVRAPRCQLRGNRAGSVLPGGSGNAHRRDSTVLEWRSERLPAAKVNENARQGLPEETGGGVLSEYDVRDQTVTPERFDFTSIFRVL